MNDPHPLVRPDNAISLNRATHVFEIDGRRPTRVSVWRWCRKGINGIRLTHGRIGRQIVTSEEACARFMNELAATYP